jgi:hypothetical protein
MASAPGDAHSAAVLPDTGALLGAYVQPDDWSRREQMAAVNDLEGDLGRRLDIDHYYYAWGDIFPEWRQRWDKRIGRIPMISWNGTDLADIVNGSSDDRIRDRATGLRDLDVPVLLRWFYEMDDPVWQGEEIESPSQYVTAWRRMHDIFVEEEATNVQWVWCPNAWGFTDGTADTFYPGDDYVDWLCADGYNWAPVRPGSEWTSFRAIFESFHAWAAGRPQPLMIGETGVVENEPGDKAHWISRMGRTIRRTYPEIRALVYFDASATAYFGGWFDWRVDTSSSSYEAFTRLAGSTFFGGRRPSGEGRVGGTGLRRLR